MSLVLRVDIDKPYGRGNIVQKVLSKIREDYWFPAISFLGYLNPLRKFLSFLTEERIKAHIYFRRCTVPPKTWMDKSLLDGHKLGLHAENTRNYETFKKEFREVQSHFSPQKLSSFTKHGSGLLKLGKYHYAPYEPDKYLQWAKALDIPFLFGNEEIDESIDFPAQNHFYPSMFWIDRLAGYNEQFTLEWVVEIAKEKNVIVIIHPANFVAIKKVENDMRRLVSLSHRQNVSWITI